MVLSAMLCNCNIILVSHIEMEFHFDQLTCSGDMLAPTIIWSILSSSSRQINPSWLMSYIPKATKLSELAVNPKGYNPETIKHLQRSLSSLEFNKLCLFFLIGRKRDKTLTNWRKFTLPSSTLKIITNVVGVKLRFLRWLTLRWKMNWLFDHRED